MKSKLSIIVLFPVCLLVGCSLFGNGASAPNAVESKFFDINTNLVPRVSQVTNIVPVYQTNIVVLTYGVTNTTTKEVTPVQVTNLVTQTTYATNIQTVTNVVPMYQMTPGSTAKAAETIGGMVGAPFGVGGLITTGLAGAFGLYSSLRNKALAGTATLANQASGALAQNIETLMEVLKTTPQGQALQPLIQNYLVKHQTEAGVIQTVATIVDNTVDNAAAKQSADAILAAMKQIKGA